MYYSNHISADLSAKKAFILNYKIKRLSKNQHIYPLPEYLFFIYSQNILYLQSKALSDSKTWNKDVWNPKDTWQ